MSMLIIMGSYEINTVMLFIFRENYCTSSYKSIAIELT